ncbi:MAG: calcium-binding protein [Nitrosomonas sp.]|nr:MAG: calcium-binding protein [Nitrosomonas sp.]
MDNKQLEIIQTIALMFKAAPGAHYLNQFVHFVDDSGNSAGTLAALLTQTSVFQQALYSNSLSNREFSIQFIENSVAALVNVEHKAWAISEVERLLDAGANRGEVIYWAAMALAAVDESDLNWGAAARQFNNKVAVAAYYSTDLDALASSLSVLQRVTEHVTDDPSSVVTAKSMLESGVTGKVIDGYIKGAQVFADLNGDQQLNRGEASVITDAVGNFLLPAVVGFGDLVASGGIDTATGKVFKGVMMAPAGSSVINSLTTVISTIINSDNLSAQETVIRVLTSLNLNTGIDLLHFDPIKEIVRTDSHTPANNVALAVHAAAVKINILTGQVAALLTGAGVTATEDSAITFAYRALTGLFANTDYSVDLTSKGTIVRVIQNASLLAGADIPESLKIDALVADASQTIANLNQRITEISESDASKTKILTATAAVQLVAENIEAAMRAGAAKGDINATVVSTTGSLFTGIIRAAGANIGDVDGDGKSDAVLPPPSSGGGPVIPPTTKHYLATNATSFLGTPANDILSISTASTWTPLVMTAVILDGGAGINTLSVQDGSNIAAATVINFPNLFFDGTGVAGIHSVTMSAAQNQNFTGTITAPGSGVNSEEIIIIGDGAVTTLIHIENYAIGDDTTDARTVAVTQVGTSVTASSVTDTVTFNLGALDYTGTITGEATVDDTLTLNTGADISGGTITNVEALALASGASVQLSAAQNQAFTGTIIAPGTGVNGETITIVGDGAVTTLINIENYSIGADSSGARSVTITDPAANVSATSASDAVTFNLGAVVFTGTITGEATVDDTLNLSTGADITAGTIVNVAALSLALGASVRLSVTQNQSLASTIAAPGTGIHGEKITIAGDGNITALADIEIYELEDDSTNARTLTLGTNALTLIANNASDTITVNATALAQNMALTLGVSTSALIVNSLAGDIVATDLAGTLAIITADAADNGIAITTGLAATSINVAAGAASDTVDVDATALTSNTILTITSGGAAAGSVNITGLTADLAISNPSGGSISVAVADNTVDNGIAITAGASNLAISHVADGDTVTISGFTGAVLTGAIASSTGRFEITTGIAVSNLATGAGDDSFTFVAGTGLTSADTVDAGEGADTIILTGNTAIAATNFNNVSNIETITLANTNTAVAITTQDTLVAAGAVLTLSNSANSGVLTFNGAAETGGAFDITGGAANDSITGGSGNDMLAGGNGNDNIAAGMGDDTVFGGAGNDTFTFAVVTGLASADIVDGGSGTDTVVLTGNIAFTATDEFDNVQNIEAIILGNTDTDVSIITQDALVAAGATLTLSNAGNSGVLAFDGRAETNGNFIITGGSGNDGIAGGSVNNTLNGGDGDDTFTFVAGTGLTTDTVNGGTGTDTVMLTGTTAVTATQFNNVSNIETIALPDMVNTAVTITTANGLVAAGATLTVSNSANAGVLTFNGAAELDGAFAITGGSAHDTISGGSGNDILRGGEGNDTLTAGLGNDTLDGGDDNDTFRFAAVTGLTNADNVDGGTGTDIVVLTGNTAFSAVTDFDNVQHIEAITLGNTNTAVTITTQDTLVAAGAVLTLTTATTGGLTFNGAAETDGVFNITSSGTSNDTITGGIGADTITGGSGTDNIFAGDGDDTLSFAAGTGLTSADSVNGGVGTDTLALTGNTAVAATNLDNVSNIEIITVANTNRAVAITTKDSLVAAGAILTLQATTLTSGILTFNGASETDGAFSITGGGANDIITGSSGDDILNGGNGNDSLTAGLGTDTLSGEAGNDTFTFVAVTGLTNADLVDGGAGTDTVVLTGNAAFTAVDDFDNVQNIEAITLGNTNTAVTITTQDTLVAAGATLSLTATANSSVLTFNGSAETDGNFTITGGSGNDNIISGSANNTLSGGNGDDIFTFVAGTGLTTDTVNGGNGVDTVILTGTSAVTEAQFNNVSNIEVITLADMVNTAITITTVNTLVASGAMLTLSNADNSGILTFNGAAETNGACAITGGIADDTITGGSGNDTLTGDAGNDMLTAGLGNDTLSGGAGNDTFIFAAGTGLTSADVVDGSSEADTVILTGNTAIAATNFNNVRNIETITIANTTTNVAITTLDTLVASGAGLTFQATALTTGILTFIGSAETNGTFHITGGAANDSITGGTGHDTLAGGNGNDSLTAGLGNDTLSGGAGNDTLRFAAVTGLTSEDMADGGTGTDTIALTGNTAFAASTYFDNVQNIEAITLGNTTTAVTITAQDTLVAEGATLSLSNAANSGVLTFDGRGETDGIFTISGGKGNDSITGGSGNDTVSGGTGNDTLDGGAGNDVMVSGAGTDNITGGTGADTIMLGSGANDNARQTVIFSSASDGAAAGANSGADSITQFDANANTATDDLIKFSGALKTALNDDDDAALDYSASNGTDLGNQAIAGGANQEATVLGDAEIELVLADFTTDGLANVLAELGEEIDFSNLSTNEEHLFIINFSATQAALVLYTAISGGDDTITAPDIQVLGMVTHNDATGLVAGNATF